MNDNKMHIYLAYIESMVFLSEHPKQYVNELDI